MENTLTRKEFDVLTALADTNIFLSQRQLEAQTGHSLATINRIIKTLSEKNLILDGKITQSGLNALEPYKVKRAIFIAAGFGSRLVPVTLNTPKPLIRVKGQRLIDGLIDACLAIGIEEIYIVRGYLAEQFDQLLYKYPMIQFLENPSYNVANNISSAIHARHLLSNAYVFEADLLIHNPKILKKYHYTSDFLGIKTDYSDDWCFTTRNNNTIASQKIGGTGTNCYQQVGISYWNLEDGKKLETHLEQAYEMPGGKEYYWEQVPLTVFPNEYVVEICECTFADIIEIDTFSELKIIDKTYDV